ncbi:FadR/GntR family transcriptional regulator [Streptomyces sp. NPDC059697]|uniref:FadR/GntR family transcriptional regulator n=1 Tax=Streptomyces sp. NPDC059697 TaxID=3346912 RepID=UPI0036BEB4FD
MQPGPVRPRPLVEQAAERLRARIADGGWSVGARLPGETTLAAELGVGRSTVREALRALAGAGLVRPRQGSGVFVIATEPVEDWPTRLRRAAVTDVYEVRILVEVQAARLAAARRTPEDVTALDTALAGRRAASAGDDAAFVDADIALHAAVVAAAHNPVLADLFREFVPALREGLIEMLDLVGMREHDPNTGDDAHAALVRAVADGDAETAGTVLRGELEETLALLRRP